MNHSLRTIVLNWANPNMMADQESLNHLKYLYFNLQIRNYMILMIMYRTYLSHLAKRNRYRGTL